jgi:hypothetical protein
MNIKKIETIRTEYIDRIEYKTIGYSKFHREDGPALEYFGGKYKGHKAWYINNLLHREDGPAMESWTGSKEWYIKGKLHRVGGPAYIDSKNNYSQWLKNGLLHRLNAPAVINKNFKEFWEFGAQYNDYYGWRY